MQPFSSQRQEILDLCRRAAQAARPRDAALAAQFEEAARGLDAGKLSVAVIGEFKRGKSSLLNALLEQPGLFPVKPMIATSMVTTATYGERERITVTTEQGEVEIAREEIPDYVTEQGNPGNDRGAKLVRIELPSPKLKDGLEICDTPGTGGMYKDHTAVTYRFVTRADVVLFVIDALTPLSTEELEFLETVREHCHAVVFAMTKTDTVDGFQVLVDNAREKVDAVFGERSAEIPIVPVSNTFKLAWLESRDPEDLEDSNFPALEDALWGLLRRRRGALLFLRPLNVLARGLDVLIAPIEAELATYDAGGGPAQDEDELTAGAARIDALRRGEAAWRRRLGRELQDFKRDMSDEMDRRSALARRGLNAALEDEQNLREPQRLLDLLDRELTLLSSDLATLVEQRLAIVSGHIEGETGLELSPLVPAERMAVEVEGLELSSVQLDGVMGVTLLKAGMGISAGAGALALLAMPLVWIGAPVVLAGAAAIFGATQGGRLYVKQQLKQDRGELRGLLARRLQPALEDELARVDEHVRRAVDDGERALADDLDAKLVQERTRLTESAAAIRAARARGKEEAERRIAALRAPLATLRGLRESVQVHIESALTAGDETVVEPEPETAPEPAPPPALDWADQDAGVHLARPEA
jgi:ribosome biogenesis GTPase A